VRRELLVEGTKPIAADAYLLEAKIEAVFNSARGVKCAQMGLANESRGAASAKEAAFLETVLVQRDAEIRIAQIRRSTLAPKSAKKRAAELAAKEKAAGGSGGQGGATQPLDTGMQVTVLGPEGGSSRDDDPQAIPVA
jgi:hypothetical protein